MFGHHHHHGQQHPQGGGYPPTSMPPPQQEQTFKIFCRADEGYCLTVRHNAVVLAPTDPRDHGQHWYKDMRLSSKVKDQDGHPAFALVNRATGLAIKHSLGQSHPVQLAPYNPEKEEDASVLWTESNDVGKGFRCIRMVNNVRLNFDAFHGDKRHGGVHDGTAVVLWEWAKGDNQSWKILPWGDEAYSYPAGPGGSHHHAQDPGYGGGGYRPPMAGAGYSNLPRALASESTVRVYCKADDAYSLTVRNGAVCLAPTNPRDEFQHWVKDMRHSTSVKDQEGYPAFALVNKVTGEAIKHSLGQSHPVRLVPYNADYVDESVMWTESRDVGHGFRCIRMVNNIYLNFDAFHGDKDHGGVHDGTTVVLWEWAKGDNQRWRIVPW